MKLLITIEGKAYEVDVEVLEDEESTPAPPPAIEYPPLPPLPDAPFSAAQFAPQPPRAPSRSGAWDEEGKVCQSPVTGLVVKVNVQPGQIVQAGDLVLVLEAMKMETNVTAPHAGTVKSVHVSQGDSVKVNDLLVEFD